MNKEIGSEFWNAGPKRQDSYFFLAGRTALEFIIRDILNTHNVKSALLPSYCCHTMIEPFFRHGINVRFYDVVFVPGVGLSAKLSDIDVLENEIFYYISYFGFQKMGGVSEKEIKRKAEVIIEDQTHSWLTEHSFGDADYTFTSYRKWTGFSAIATAVKHCGDFIKLSGKRNSVFYQLRKQASNLKKSYIEYDVGDKQDYLRVFNEAEELLENDYVDYLPEYETICEFINFDRAGVSNIRRNNAAILMEGIKGIKGIKLIYPELLERDVPLFVPVYIENNREEFKTYLISQAIYCPSHWPISDYHNGISKEAFDLYEHELSIICDQRYDESDMERIVNVIRDYFEVKK